MTFPTLLENYGAHIIGAAALVQVWIIAAWKKWILKGKIRFHSSASIEISFSTFGSTVGLPGALRALRKDVFVTEMRVKIVRDADDAKHDFSWRFFRSSKFTAPTLAPENIGLATSFIVPVTTPRPINIIFSSENFTPRYEDLAIRLQSAWANFLLEKKPTYGDQIAARLQDPVFVDGLFQEFSSDPSSIDLSTRINNEFFWQTGRYTVELQVFGADIPKKTYRWYVELETQDEERLRANIVTTMKEICRIPAGYDFIYKPYSVDA